MNSVIKIKLCEIYLPFLMVSAGTLCLYVAFRWLFDIKLGLLPLKDDLLDLWIPFALPWIPILIVLRKRVRILDIKTRKASAYDWRSFYLLIAGAVTIIPLLISQEYIEKATYKLRQVNTVEDIKGFGSERYFEVNAFNIDQYADHPHYVAFRTTGRNNDKLQIKLFIACRFADSRSVWYGVEYREFISNFKSQEEKNICFDEFMIESRKDFVTYDFRNVKYFEKLGYSDDRDGFISALKSLYPGINAKEQIILVPEREDFRDKSQNLLFWTFVSFGIGALIVLLMILIPSVDRVEFERYKLKKPLQNDGFKLFLRFINPRGNYKGTAILILVNAAVFAVMVLLGLNIFSPSSRELFEMGGNRRSEVLGGEYWRLLSSVFIHGGLLHLIMNIISLAFAGMLLEKVLGWIRLIISFLICGILASLASIYWHENTISVGASGAIMGLYGVVIAFNIFRIFPVYSRGFNWIIIGLFAGISLLFGFLGGIDNAAHLGGLIAGFVLGAIYTLLDKERLKKTANEYFD